MVKLFALILAFSSALSLAHVAPHLRCAAWLEVRPVDPAAAAQTVQQHWERVSERFPPGGSALRFVRNAAGSITRWFRSPEGPTVVSDRDDGGVAGRLARTRSDLSSVPERHVAINQVITGTTAILRHLDQVDARAEVVGARFDDPAGFRALPFVDRAVRGGVYAGLATVLFVVAGDQAEAARWVSVIASTSTAIAVARFAEAHVTAAYLNLKNGFGGSTQSPVGLDRLVEAENEFTRRVRRALETPGGGEALFLSTDVPLPLSVSARGWGRWRRAPTAEQIRRASDRWPADPRHLVLDRALYFDSLGRPTLLIYARESL